MITAWLVYREGTELSECDDLLAIFASRGGALASLSREADMERAKQITLYRDRLAGPPTARAYLPGEMFMETIRPPSVADWSDRTSWIDSDAMESDRPCLVVFAGVPGTGGYVVATFYAEPVTVRESE